MRDKKKIFIACGGSAGHIFPGLALAEEIIKDYGDSVEVSFLTTDNALGKSLLRESRFDFHTLPVKGLNIRSPGKLFSFAYSLIKGSLKSMRIIFSGKPDFFVGFGAYVAGPPFVASSLLGVPTLIHEQNAAMGRANRMMRAFATKVALSFPDDTGKPSKNTVVTGNPISALAVNVQDKGVCREFLSLETDRFTVLVMGGSQGSSGINIITVDMFKNMDAGSKNKIQVVHICGESDYENVKAEYGKTGMRHVVYPFFKGMGVVYSAADVAISRAGSSAIFELCAHRIPCILIPYPFAERHQTRNASFLGDRGAACVIDEKDLSEETLLSKLAELMKDGGLRDSMKAAMGSLAKTDAAKALSNEIGRLMKLKTRSL
ncbi:MAG: undecaprenyldiphospho-muramoylpentapeptide beta-N-acetylglucosaminyltransferase [Candidatus Omnitrophica bacterium]|nr:undecaprenyldiphospho-muramoylpentapeptide beta-N-acetylglucosaminyltransferase [Candidatus Omnitrophota bacterium]